LFGRLFATATATATFAGICDCLLDCFTRFTRTFLDAAEQFVVFAFSVLKIIIRKLGPLLLQLAFRDIPIPFNFKFVHNTPSFFFMFAVNMTANEFFKTPHLTAKHEQHNNDDKQNADRSAADPDSVGTKGG
jgi:hypothetical protein